MTKKKDCVLSLLFYRTMSFLLIKNSYGFLLKMRVVKPAFLF